MTYELPDALRQAATRLAAFVGARADDLAFVENATAGCNAVLRSFPFRSGDEVLVTDHGYPAVRKATEYAALRSSARVIEATVPFPLEAPAQVVEAVASRIGPRTRLAIIDHITSPTAVVFPVHEIAALLHRAGVRVLIDGAHAPGMVDLDVPALGADWYVGNCHKWLMAPKGSAFLWADPARQADLHPTVISHGYGQGLTAEFDWVGTRDPSAWLATPSAIDFHEALGGTGLRERNVRLADEAGSLLARRWQTERGAPDLLTGSMVSIRLPIAGQASPERAQELRAWLYHEHRIEVAVVAFGGALWARVSAQAYNSFPDYDRFGAVFTGCLPAS
jgi:isopenicillin-N epimerase